jgi:transcriptional regulator with XRE-family HTH domain
MMNDLAGRIKLTRAHFGLSAAEMASRVGLRNRKSWEGYEKGLNTPKADVLRQLVLLGINPRWLLIGEGEMVGPEQATDHAGMKAVATGEAVAGPEHSNQAVEVDADLLELVIREVDRYNQAHDLFHGTTELARLISLGYAMLANEKAKGNRVSLEALHYVLRAGRSSSPP